MSEEHLDDQVHQSNTGMSGGTNEGHSAIEAAPVEPVQADREREAQERQQERAEDNAPTEPEPVPEGEGPI